MIATLPTPTLPTAERPVVVCDVAHPQDACVQFFGSDGNIRAARLTVLGVRPTLPNGQPMPLVEAFTQLEAQAAERERHWRQRSSGRARATSRAERLAANYERHGDPDPWDGDDAQGQVQQSETSGSAGPARMRVEIVKPPVIR